MHIKNIAIKNFRNFSDDFHIDFTKGFQTIIGENNIGKSNLYWAIRLVLDENLSYKARKLEEKDFHGFNKLSIDSFVIISIEFFGSNLASFPNLHAIKTSENTARVTYLYCHKSKLIETDEVFDKIQISDFQWRLYGGGNSIVFEDIIKLSQISLKDLEGINLYYITAFRNIYSDLFGSSKSLLSQYCKSRDNSEDELGEVKKILSSSTDKLNELEFIPNVTTAVKEKNDEIAGKHFSFPISFGFHASYDADVWNQLNLYFNPDDNKNIPIIVLGLGQKNILYLSLFLSKLINEQDKNKINILLIEEPEVHLHPQLQKILFSNLGGLSNTQVFMTSHSTHIASDCEHKNLNILFKTPDDTIKSFSPFNNLILTGRETLLLKRYLDATRTELFFASAVILVEGVGEQFIIPAIAKEKYGVNLVEHNVSVVPIHSRYFDPFLKLFQDKNLEIVACAIIDGDKNEIKEGEEYSTSVANAKKLEVKNRVEIFKGEETLEIDLFPDNDTNSSYLKECFDNLEHKTSFNNLIKADGEWSIELMKRIDGTIKKGRFAQELSLLIDKDFTVPKYIDDAIKFICSKGNIEIV